MKILAIDPGPTESGFAVWDGHEILDCGKVDNNYLLGYISVKDYDWLILEKIVSYGRAVGQTTFDTVFWTGRFYQVASQGGIRVSSVVRREVRLYHCNNDTKAKDSNVIQALKDRFEPNLEPRKKPKGILKSLRKDAWQAFALSVYYYDINLKQ